MHKIAVSITTHNRYDVFKNTYNEFLKYRHLFNNFTIIDDGSVNPVPEATFRFDKARGISIAKNKALELMGEADHYFCFDDDIYPIDANWATWYTHSNLQHACYIFERKLLWTEPDYKAYELPRGCLLYFTKHCIETAGGFDTNFTNQYEHAELSRRIFNMKLTPSAYIDIPHSKGLFYSHDEQNTGQSCFDPYERTKAIRENKKYWEETKLSNQFIPYK